MRNIVVIGVAGLVLVGLGAAWLVSAGNPAGPAADNGTRDLTAGAALYAQNCAACHGKDLQGQPDWQTALVDGTFPAPPHDARGHTWHHDDAMLFSYTKLGGAAALEQSGVNGFKSGMPGFADRLSDAQIRDVLAYIESTWTDRMREARAARTGGG